MPLWKARRSALASEWQRGLSTASAIPIEITIPMMLRVSAPMSIIHTRLAVRPKKCPRCRTSAQSILRKRTVPPDSANQVKTEGCGRFRNSGGTPRKRGMVPGAGFEPARPKPADFKSAASTWFRHPGGRLGWGSGAGTPRRVWRLRSESNRRTRLCRPLHDHSATQPEASTDASMPLSTDEALGAGNETRTRDPNLGKVVLYQLSYSRADARF